MEILDRITEKLHGKVKEANFEGANIVLYTDNEKFFKEGEGQIKKIVDEIKKNRTSCRSENFISKRSNREKNKRNSSRRSRNNRNFI